jgi:hypothetical protein
MNKPSNKLKTLSRAKVFSLFKSLLHALFAALGFHHQRIEFQAEE